MSNGGRKGSSCFLALLGLAGFVLGILNYILARRKDAVRLVLIRGLFRPENSYSTYIQIEIKNLSAWPVTIAKIGFLAQGGFVDTQYLEPSLPLKIDSRASVTFTVMPIVGKTPAENVRGFWVKTECGKEAFKCGAIFKPIADYIVRQETHAIEEIERRNRGE